MKARHSGKVNKETSIRGPSRGSHDSAVRLRPGRHGPCLRAVVSCGTKRLLTRPEGTGHRGVPVSRCRGDSAPGSAAAPDGQLSQTGWGGGRSRPGADTAGGVAWAPRVLPPGPADVGCEGQLEDGRCRAGGTEAPAGSGVSSSLGGRSLPHHFSSISLFFLEPTGKC